MIIAVNPEAIRASTVSVIKIIETAERATGEGIPLE